MQPSFDQLLFNNYERFKEPGLEVRRVHPALIHEKIRSICDSEIFKVKTLGYSIENHPISLLSAGKGEKVVLMWAQMHGNESTATRAILDILHFFHSNDDEFRKQRADIFDQLTFHIIPVLNPDGAVRFDRLNAIGIDLNRDADKLQTPESQLLKEVIDDYKPLFGFNLHDQNRSHAAGASGNPATMTFLAPPYNDEREVNEVRERSMKLIGQLYEMTNQYIPNHIGKWSDEYEPRAFGDKITEWGTSVVLFESGGYPADREKSLSRKLHFVSILSALNAIASDSYQNMAIDTYDQIPFNESRMMDVIIRNISYEKSDKLFQLDIGINLTEHEMPNLSRFWVKGEIEEIGDLSNAYGYQEFDGDGLILEIAKIHPDVIKDSESLNQLDFKELYKKGIGWIQIEDLPEKGFSDVLMNLLPKGEIPTQNLSTDINPTFVLKDKTGAIRYLFINGFEVNLSHEDETIKKGMVYGKA